jgi:hypothetical protein
MVKTVKFICWTVSSDEFMGEEVHLGFIQPSAEGLPFPADEGLVKTIEELRDQNANLSARVKCTF